MRRPFLKLPSTSRRLHLSGETANIPEDISDRTWLQFRVTVLFFGKPRPRADCSLFFSPSPSSEDGIFFPANWISGGKLGRIGKNLVPGTGRAPRVDTFLRCRHANLHFLTLSLPATVVASHYECHDSWENFKDSSWSQM